jgi:hemoglobin
MRRHSLHAIVIGLVLVGWPGHAAPEPAKPEKSLYERIGRYDGISAIAEEYLRTLRADPAFARFKGRGADSLRRAKQMLKDLLCEMSGGPCSYPGRDMKTAHGGLAITEAEWAGSMKHMTNALDSRHVPAKEKQEFLALIEGVKGAIVEGGR